MFITMRKLINRFLNSIRVLTWRHIKRQPLPSMEPLAAPLYNQLTGPKTHQEEDITEVKPQDLYRETPVITRKPTTMGPTVSLNSSTQDHRMDSLLYLAQGIKIQQHRQARHPYPNLGRSPQRHQGNQQHLRMLAVSRQANLLETRSRQKFLG